MTILNDNLTNFEKIEIIDQRINLLDGIILSNQTAKNQITESNGREISNLEEYEQMIQEMYNIKQALLKEKSFLTNQG
jgi:hypothetical protein